MPDLVLGNTIRTILLGQLSRHPAMQIVDIYKLVHQASMGSEHAVSDRGAAQLWLEQELASLGAGPDDPLVDPISHDGSILRIHLRPFIAQGGDPIKLLDAFIRTANEFHGSTTILQDYWNEVTKMAAAGELPFSREEVCNFGEEMAAQHYHAMHHSRVYAEVYKPAYRVVAKVFWQTFQK